MATKTYNRIYSTMFEGSLYGKGALAIACWAYVLAEMKPDFGKAEFYVTLNPQKVSDALGEPEEAVRGVIERFCQAEGDSQSDKEEGRKLVGEGSYNYRVVNGAAYNEIKKREEKREANRVAQQNFRAKKKQAAPAGIDGETAFLKAQGDPVKEEAVLEEVTQVRKERAEATSPSASGETQLPPTPGRSSSGGRRRNLPVPGPPTSTVAEAPTVPRNRTLAQHQAARVAAGGPGSATPSVTPPSTVPATPAIPSPTSFAAQVPPGAPHAWTGLEPHVGAPSSPPTPPASQPAPQRAPRPGATGVPSQRAALSTPRSPVNTVVSKPPATGPRVGPARQVGAVLSGIALPAPRPNSASPRPSVPAAKIETAPRTEAGVVPGTGEGSVFGGWAERTVVTSKPGQPAHSPKPQPPSEEEPPVD